MRQCITISLYFFICSFLFTYSALAQDKVVLKDGTLIEGELNLTKWLHQRAVVLIENDKTILSSTIHQVNINNKLYETTDNSIVLNSLNSTSEIIFLEVLIDGTIKFLKSSGGQPIHYIVKNDSIKVLEINILQSKAIGSKEKETYRYENRKILMNVLTDCSLFNFKSINEVELNEKSVEGTLRKYNEECGNISYDYKKRVKEKNDFRLEIFTGWNRMKILTTDYDFIPRVILEDYRENNILVNNQMIYGINSSYTLNNIKLKPSLELSAFLQSFEFDSLRYGSDDAVFLGYFKGSILKIQTGVMLQPMIGTNVKSIIGIGLTHNYILNASGAFEKWTYNFNYPDIIYSDGIVRRLTYSNLLSHSIYLKTGVQLNRFSFALQYERGINSYFKNRQDGNYHLMLTTGFALFE